MSPPAGRRGHVDRERMHAWEEVVLAPFFLVFSHFFPPNFSSLPFEFFPEVRIIWGILPYMDERAAGMREKK